MSNISDKITAIFGSHIGDQESLKAKVAGYINDRCVTEEGNLSPAAVPTEPVPFGLYKVSANGTLNGGVLTVVIGNIVLYDANQSKWVLFTTTVDNS